MIIVPSLHWSPDVTAFAANIKQFHTGLGCSLLALEEDSVATSTSLSRALDIGVW